MSLVIFLYDIQLNIVEGIEISKHVDKSKNTMKKIGSRITIIEPYSYYSVPLYRPRASVIFRKKQPI